MKTTKTLLLAATLSAVLLTATSANAALQTRLGGLAVYDTDLDITWLANANLAATNTFGLARNVNLGSNAGVTNYGPSIIYNDGNMNWGGAIKWIAAMNATSYLGYNDWRLPTTIDTGAPGGQFYYNGTDSGYNNPTTSEMSHLYYSELGNKGFYNTIGDSQQGFGLVDDPNNPNDENLFTNLQSAFYWSGTEYAPWLNIAWFFRFYNGYQDSSYKDSRMYAIVVRPGDVASVPVPAAAWLLGSGLLGLIGVARRKAV